MPRRMSGISNSSVLSKYSIDTQASIYTISSSWHRHRSPQESAKKAIRIKKRDRDRADVLSLDPSYATFSAPYDIHCAYRYQSSQREYKRQFRREIKLLRDYQPSAYEAAMFHRIVTITTLWPPLHTRRELENVRRYFFPQCQGKRLHNLMQNTVR